MTKNHIGGAALFFVGLAYFIGACNFPHNPLSEGVGSAFWPQMASIGLMICSVGVFFSKPDEKEPSLSLHEFKRAAAFFVILLAYVAGIWLIGFVLSTLVFCYVSVSMMAPADAKPPVRNRVIFSVLMTAALYVIFDRVFLLLLPSGLLFH